VLVNRKPAGRCCCQFNNTDLAIGRRDRRPIAKRHKVGTLVHAKAVLNLKGVNSFAVQAPRAANEFTRFVEILLGVDESGLDQLNQATPAVAISNLPLLVLLFFVPFSQSIRRLKLTAAAARTSFKFVFIVLRTLVLRPCVLIN
jgi:hypothetical protein